MFFLKFWEIVLVTVSLRWNLWHGSVFSTLFLAQIRQSISRQWSWNIGMRILMTPTTNSLFAFNGPRRQCWPSMTIKTSGFRFVSLRRDGQCTGFGYEVTALFLNWLRVITRVICPHFGQVFTQSGQVVISSNMSGTNMASNIFEDRRNITTLSLSLLKGADLMCFICWRREGFSPTVVATRVRVWGGHWQEMRGTWVQLFWRASPPWWKGNRNFYKKFDFAWMQSLSSHPALRQFGRGSAALMETLKLFIRNGSTVMFILNRFLITLETLTSVWQTQMIHAPIGHGLWTKRTSITCTKYVYRTGTGEAATHIATRAWGAFLLQLLSFPFPFPTLLCKFFFTTSTAFCRDFRLPTRLHQTIITSIMYCFSFVAGSFSGQNDTQGFERSFVFAVVWEFKTNIRGFVVSGGWEELSF